MVVVTTGLLAAPAVLAAVLTAPAAQSQMPERHSLAAGAAGAVHHLEALEAAGLLC